MNTITVTSSTRMGRDMRWIVGDQGLESYSRPGQFVTVHLNEIKPAYFAIASEVGAPLGFLVKEGGAAADALIKLQSGDQFEVSDTIGNGFPMERVEGLDLLIMATGSGISAVRSVIAREIDLGMPRSIHLLYGVRTPAHRAFPDDLDAWKSAGVSVTLVVSRPDEGWTGHVGYVQRAAEAMGLVKPGIGVVLCGQKGLVDDTKELFAAIDAPMERLLTNF